jgi:hypothetical protein
MRSAGTPTPTPADGAPPAGPRGRSQLGIEPLDARTLLASHLVNDNSAVVSDYSKLFHQIICSPKTAMVPRQGPVGAADPW